MQDSPRYGGTFEYDEQEAGFFVVSMRYSNTILPAVILIPGLWIFFILHVFLWSNHRYEFIPGFAEMVRPGGQLYVEPGSMKVIGGITVFFEVFYTSQCYTRYFKMGNSVNNIFQTAHKILLEQNTLLNKAGPQYTRLVARWLRACLLMFLKELKHAKLPQSAWNEAVGYGVLQRQEVSSLADLDMMTRNNRLVQWMMRVTLAAYEVDSKGPPILMALMNRQVMFRDELNGLLQTYRMPVPFVYYHLLNAMICINCALWAVSMSATQSVFGPFVFLVSCLLYVGMLEVAKAMSNPFGDDDVDFPLELWYDKFIEAHRTLLLDYDIPMSQFDAAMKKELETSPSQAQMYLGSVIGNRAPSDDASKKEDLDAQNAGYALLETEASRPSTTA